MHPTVNATSNPSSWGLISHRPSGVCPHCNMQSLKEVILPGMDRSVIACIMCAWVRTPTQGVTEKKP
jgi:hypothetical protein